jgi:hypothetical protein
MGEKWNSPKTLVETLRWQKPLDRPRRRRADNIKIDLTETGYESKSWIQPAYDKTQWNTHVNSEAIMVILYGR